MSQARFSSDIRIPAKVQPVLRAIGRLAGERGLAAYAVGGCVRDWLLGRADAVDLDVAVEGSGIALARAAAEALEGTMEPHEPFGTATVLLPAPLRRVDFATCRKEVYAAPAAYPKVRPGRLEDDLLRRDFTINAMAVALDSGRFGRLIDPYGGARDLRSRRLRILHARSFLDDPSRILRGIRFAQRFRLRWEPGTRRALRRAMAEGALGWLNGGRLRKELARVLEEPDPLACVRALDELL
jgi:tRNA nucleotidyltransferase (CCA-adding enzyme)